MLKVGITGGIGSGKTTVCSIITALGYPVYNADSEAKLLVNSNQQIIDFYKQKFGENIYLNGLLNSKLVAQKVFANANLLQQVNAVVHPIVAEHFDKWCKEHNDFSILFKEAAILFESGTNKNLHRVIGVFASEEERVQRVVKRDNAIESEVRERMLRQYNNQTLEKLCHFHIYNQGTELLLPKVLNVVSELEKLTKSLKWSD